MTEGVTEMTPRLRIVVLISGRGTNLQAIIDAIAGGSLPADLRAVICNEPDAPGVERAREAGYETAVVHHRDFPGREQFDAALADTIDAFGPELVVLAGFMRVLTPGFVRRYAGRLINVHPSLLPELPGLDTHARAIASGAEVHGATVHFVTEALDGGPSIVQARVPILAKDDPETLAARVLEQEHVILPRAIRWFAQGRIGIDGDRVLLDGLPIRSLSRGRCRPHRGPAEAAGDPKTPEQTKNRLPRGSSVSG